MTSSQFVRNGNIDLAVYTWGEASADKATVVLVHDYPDSASVWQTTAALLAERFHVVAYDVRGTGRSSVPAAIRDFAIAYLMDDLEAVLDAVSPQRKVHLVCHDWGSIQCWEAVTTAPLQQRIASYHTISGPSLDHVGFWMRSHVQSGNLRQLMQVANQFRRSWYMAFFQIPSIAPALWRAMGSSGWLKLMQLLDGTHGDYSTTQVKDGSEGIKLYRANIVQRLLRPQLRYTEVPVQLIVPTRDPFANQDIYNQLPRWASKLWRRELVAGHWAQLSHPAVIAQFVSEFVDFIESGEESALLKAARFTTSTATLLLTTGEATEQIQGIPS